MAKIARLGLKIESRVASAAQSRANRDFIMDAINAFKSVGGTSGDGALEIYRDIDKDIDTMASFLETWQRAGFIDSRVLALAKELHSELTKLRGLIKDTPQDMMIKCKEIVMDRIGR
jgi:hypothetical protein